MAITIPAATDQIDYADLYARWERGNWSATEIDFTPGPHRLAREVHRRAAPRRAVALHAVLPRRGLGRRQPLAVHRRRAAGGAEVLPRHAAGRRGAPRGLLPSLDARGRRRRRRLAGQRAEGHRARAHVGAPQALRPPGPDGRRAALRPLAAHAHEGDHALPHHRRGHARPARPAHDRDLARADGPHARLPRGDAPDRDRRAAPHRLRRQAARRPVPREPRADAGGDRRPHPRGPAVGAQRADPAGLGHDVHREPRLLDGGPLRGGRALQRGAPAGDRAAARRHPAFPVPDGDHPAPARPARARVPAVGAARPRRRRRRRGRPRPRDRALVHGAARAPGAR